MKKLFVLALIVVVTLVMTATAFAVGPGKTVEYAGKGAGKVIFDGKSHAAKAKCADCHTQTKLFPMKKGGEAITMKDMDAGKNCGACHNGTKAFGTKDCAKCHKK